MSGKLKMLSAGAGAGKTYSLSNEIIKSIKNGVPPEKIMATTFTIKAAEELIERVRLMLLEQGERDFAARILDGYVGTMNSVFGRLLKEFALELGLSPVQQVLAESEASTLFKAIASEVNEQFYRDYRTTFSRLAMDGSSDEDWRKTVLEIIEEARANNMTPQDVQACAIYSWESMDAWLPEAALDGESLDENLKSALIVAKSVLPGEDTTKKTLEVADTIKSALNEWERNGFLSWGMWAKLSKLSPGKKSAEAVSPIHAAASIHDRHPRLHQDLKDAMFALFNCAAEAMEIYRIEKSKRGLIDFTDQESIALSLLLDEQNKEALQDRISAVFVDEFQDSSPLQIALNMRLREIADSATWVGDVKQAIYGFRGTDPELMQTAMTSILDMEVEVLDASWRSRQSLVEFVNSLFVPVFEGRGMEREQIRLNPKRADRQEQALAVEAWSYPHSKNLKGDAALIAAGIEKVLSQKEQYVLIDKISREPRILRAGDIAVLCRSNDECIQIAEALSDIGIRATVGESGLLATPEVGFAVAAMRYLVDYQDTLALAEIIHFSSEEWGEGRWIFPWLEKEDDREWISSEPLIQALDHARSKIIQMSPSEVLDLAIVSAKVDEISLRWGEGEQRLANLDALRNLAVVYEENSGTNRTAATISGFLLFLTDVERDKEMNLVAESTDEHAVRVLTYHKAKGLEWPFVILNSLGKSSKRKKLPVFDRVTAVSTEGFNVEAPLHGRRLYYWPWPYAAQSSNVSLDSYVENAPQLQQREQQLMDENQRLMYVGMTRARDYLVFTARDFSKVGWLEELIDGHGNPVVRGLGVVSGLEEVASLDDQVGKIFLRDEEFPCRVRVLSIEEERVQVVQEGTTPEMVYVGKSLEASPFIPARFIPSGHGKDESKKEEGIGVKGEEMLERSRIHRIGNRLPLSGNPEMAILGEMVHSFLAADHRLAPKEERLALAAAIQERYSIHALSVDSLLEASDRLASFVAQTYPELLEEHYEWPIHLRKGLQKASGWIDLLYLTPNGWVIIDHKSFPGREASWLSHAKGYLPQLQIYAEALKKATGQPVIEAWIHMPVVGAMIHFDGEELNL